MSDDTMSDDTMSDDTIYKFTFGKHRGKSIDNVPASYLLWCCEQESMMEIHPEIKQYIKENKRFLEEEVEHDREIEEDLVGGIDEY